MKKERDYKSLLLKAVVILLCVIFAAFFVWGLNEVLNMEGSFPPVNIEEGLTPAPETVQDAIDLLNLAVEKAVKEKPKLEISDSFDIDSDSIETTGSDFVLKSMEHIKGGAVSHLEDSTESVTADFGEGFEDLLWIPKLSASQADSFECSYQYYRCPSCGVESDVAHENCEDCGYAYPYNLLYRGDYSVTIHFKPETRAFGENSVIESNFHPRSDEQIAAITAGMFDGVLTHTPLEVSYEDIYIAFKVDRLTNKLTFLEYGKNMPVSSTVTFTDEYSQLGKAQASFILSEQNRFSFTWPSLDLNNETMAVEQKTTDNLLATLTCDDPTAYTVKWSSSDESVVSVDDEGYFTAGKKDGEATITASFEFQGKTYSDSCTVYVRTSVEGIKINKHSAEISAGETLTLKISVSPGNATVQSVKWYSSDESVATVDENGVVTAIGAGTSSVYALTDDGYYKATCEVTVK